MNIVKFKDVITESEFFNENLKGKYALAVNYKYIIPLGITGLTDDSSHIIELEYQQLEELPSGELDFQIDGGDFHLDRDFDYVLFEDYGSYAEDLGDIQKYIYLNNFTTDEDITLEELKKFRTWLAEILYANEIWIDEWSKDPDKHRYMLQYYIQEMYDQVVRSLMKFNNFVDINSISKQSGCGCSNGFVSYTSNGLTMCDPLLIYRHNIYKYMIEVFSDVSYWLGQEEICGEMKKYIDNIIKSNLPLTSVTLYDKFADCTCINIDANEQDTLMNILKRLSLSLGYIINHNTSGNRNYIASAFLDWSTYLYEKMRW
jgi:hypothetical protein